jgi:hypothetical protein
MKPLGIIQSAGLGDIVIALPIARHYYEQGREILWPVRADFLPSFRDTVPWIRWLPVPFDPGGDYLYDGPLRCLRDAGCDQWICLYQVLSSHPELSNVPWFQTQKFDEFKYTRAAVPFSRKWTLGETCLTRSPERERALAAKLNPEGRPYFLVHLTSSNYRAQLQLDNIPADWLAIDMTPETDCVFDWLSLMEGARMLVMIDSVFANIADQLLLPVTKYWVPRSPIFLTPVLGAAWTILPPPADSLAAIHSIPQPQAR